MLGLEYVAEADILSKNVVRKSFNLSSKDTFLNRKFSHPEERFVVPTATYVSIWVGVHSSIELRQGNKLGNALQPPASFEKRMHGIWY